MNFHWEIGSLMLGCWLDRWDSVPNNEIEDFFVAGEGKTSDYFKKVS